jgi:hypothetical protein
MGATCATSMKTTLLLLALTLAACVLLVLRRVVWGESPRPGLWKSCALTVAGMMVVPGVLVALFAAWHALPQMYYAVIQHNTVPGLGKWRKGGFHLFIFPISVPVFAALAAFGMRAATDRAQAAGRALVLMTGGFFLTLLRSYWPLVTAQDYAPFVPLLTIVVVPLFASLSARAQPRLRYALPALLVCGELVWILAFHKHRLTDKSVRVWNDNLAETLRITDPGDHVMDAKGETIFRTRPFYFVLEGVTLARMKLGLIRNDICERLLATKTCVVVNHRLREPAETWARENYVPGKNKICVAGKKFAEIPAAGAISFRTELPADYALVFARNPVAATLDGKPVTASQWVVPGAHELRFAPGGSGGVALVWAQAAQRGWTPFFTRKRDRRG